MSEVDIERIEELPEEYELAAKGRLSGIDRMRLAAENMMGEDEELDEVADG